MAITKTDVLAIAPELTEVTDDQWSAIFENVAVQLNANAFGSQARFDMASKYLAAHFGSLLGAGGGSSSGNIKAVSVAGIGITYKDDASGATGSGLSATAYGQEFQRLRRMFVPTFFIA